MVIQEIRCNCKEKQLLGKIEDNELEIRWIKYKLKINKLADNYIEITCPQCKKKHKIKLENGEIKEKTFVETIF